MKPPISNRLLAPFMPGLLDGLSLKQKILFIPMYPLIVIYWYSYKMWKINSEEVKKQ